MTQLVFDEDTAARIESLYAIGEAVRRRALVRGALGARPAERIADARRDPAPTAPSWSTR